MDDSEYNDLLLPGSGSIFGSAATEESLGDLGFDGAPTAVSGFGEVSGLGAVSKDTSAVAPAPMPASPVPQTSASMGAAISLFTVAAGGLVGYKFRGAKGAAGGALAAAGARNLWRAKGSGGLFDKSGGMQQGIIGLAGVCFGAYLLFSKE